MPKIDWNSISESNVLILKENETAQVKFLDEGSHETTEITDKATNELKTIDKYVFKVVDLSDNKKKELSTLSNRFMVVLKSLKPPFKDRSFNINKFRFGADDYDIDFRMTEITKP